MRLLVGLGNPGTKYQHNRHNIGFMAIDAIIAHHHLPPPKDKFQGSFTEGDIATPGGDRLRCRLLKPGTYMNESGRSVGEAMRFFKLQPHEIIVIYDEIDLERGKVRIRTGGGFAGHNGLKSIAAHIGPDFQRLRLGIGHPGEKHLVSGYVLKDFSRAEIPWLERLIESIAANIGLVLENHPNEFLNRLTLDTRPELDRLCAEPDRA